MYIGITLQYQLLDCSIKQPDKQSVIYVPMTQQRIQFKFHQNIAVLPDWQIEDAGTMIEMLALSKNSGLQSRWKY